MPTNSSISAGAEIAVRAFDFTPRTVDEAERAVDLVASTGAGVARLDMTGPFLEVLSLATGAVDLSRTDGMPLLDSHRQDALDRVLGVVRSVRVEGGQLVVSVRISERAEAIWRDIKAGIIRNVSIGYGVDRYEDRTDPATGERVRFVSRWTLFEVSLVPVGADAGAKIRGTTMPELQPVTPAQPAAPPSPIQPAPTPTRAAVNAEIRAIAATFDLGQPFVDEQIDREATVDQARAVAIEMVQRRQTQRPRPPRVTVIANHDDPAAFVSRAGEALYARANPRHQLSEPARIYANTTILDMARRAMELRGHTIAGLSPADTITRALNTTSDFPQIFGNLGERAMRAGYAAAPAVLKTLARQTTAKDFRAKTKIQIGAARTLEKVNEHGEYKYGSFGEASESYGIATYGKVFAISRQALVNDDVGAFTDVNGKFGLAAAEFEAVFLVKLLESGGGNGPTMGDSKALFHTDHGNKASSAGTPDETRLSAARLAMRKQKGLSGEPINVAPRYMLVPPDLETGSEKLLATIQATKSGDVNPFGGKLELLVEARLSSAARWYLAGDPGVIEGLEYAYLQGQEGPQIDTRAGFEIDGLETKVRLDFGAAFLDWRGWYMNAGA